MARSCARPACGGPATTTLSYDYAAATVWVEGLRPESHPMDHDLCERHAARLSVPRGWTLVDRRPGGAVPGDAVDHAPVVMDTGAEELVRRGAEAWDPSGLVDHDLDAWLGLGHTGGPDEVDEPLVEGAAVPGAVVYEPTLFGDWAAEDDRHSMAS